VSESAIIVQNLQKKYQLGTISSGTLANDVAKWWAKMNGKEDPTKIVGTEDEEEEYWALKGLDFEIKKGETVGIIGKNGAGKSTLLKILSRVTSPTQGTVKINGRVASLLEVGTGFHPELTGRENIFMNGAILGMTRHEISAKLDEIIAFSGVEKYIETPVKRYSSGMYVRLAFAVAAHLEPEIMIVDEVLAVGDAEFQKKCLGKMGDVAKDGRTVLFVSHSISSVLSLCQNAIYLKKGVLVTKGPANEVAEKYMKDSENILSLQKNDSGVYFSDVVLTDEQATKKTDFFIGEDIMIRFQIHVSVQISDLSISLDIHNRLGDLHAHVSNFDDNFKITDTQKNIHTIEIRLKNINFTPNKYLISLWSGSSYGKTYVYAERIVSFNLHQNNTYIKRTNLYPSYANTVIRSEWVSLE
jgi:lipopolysaccharide transport system ATP-binding protein